MHIIQNKAFNNDELCWKGKQNCKFLCLNLKINMFEEKNSYHGNQIESNAKIHYYVMTQKLGFINFGIF